MRWFNDLKTNSIDSYKQLIQAFGSCFITNTRVPRPLSLLLSLFMHEGETLKAYSDRYWEMYNEMDVNFDDIAISTFKSGLPTEHDLRKSLTGKPVTSVRQLMDRIDKYKKVEEDQLQGKGKERRRLSLKRGGILGWTDTIITIRGEISQDSMDQLIRRRLTLYSENRYIRFWRKSRMSHSSSGRIRWSETL